MISGNLHSLLKLVKHIYTFQFDSYSLKIASNVARQNSLRFRDWGDCVLTGRRRRQRRGAQPNVDLYPGRRHRHILATWTGGRGRTRPASGRSRTVPRTVIPFGGGRDSHIDKFGYLRCVTVGQQLLSRWV